MMAGECRPTPFSMWYCRACWSIYHRQLAAEQCCQAPLICPLCGKALVYQGNLRHAHLCPTMEAGMAPEKPQGG